MIEFEKPCEYESPDLVVVVGDVNSTLTVSIMAKKLNITVAHVEAGLRSFDLTMPEEINRMVTDPKSDYFIATKQGAIENLTVEGKSKDRFFLVGNIMIDNLHHQLKELKSYDATQFSTNDLKVNSKSYSFLTLHRPSNVDSKEIPTDIANAMNEISGQLDIFLQHIIEQQR